MKQIYIYFNDQIIFLISMEQTKLTILRKKSIREHESLFVSITTHHSFKVIF